MLLEAQEELLGLAGPPGEETGLPQILEERRGLFGGGLPLERLHEVVQHNRFAHPSWSHEYHRTVNGCIGCDFLEPPEISPVWHVFEIMIYLTLSPPWVLKSDSIEDL